jgi:uncharacterized repeat protein (TIGR01451 family)
MRRIANWTAGLVGATAVLLAATGRAAAPLPEYQRVTSEFVTPTVALDLFKQKTGTWRTIDWESIPDDKATPNAFPPDFLNTTQPAGFEFTTTGLGQFRVSAAPGNPSGAQIRFGDIDPAAPSELYPFSGDRMFTPIDGHAMSVDLFAPGTKNRALTKALGFMFTGVQAPDLTRVEFFHGGQSLAVVHVPPGGPASPSFVGVVYEQPTITSAIITLGGKVGEAETLNPAFGNRIVDVVALDDIVYAPLVPSAGLAVGLRAVRDGTNVHYATSVSNISSYEAQNVRLVQTLPADVTFLSATAGASVIEREVTWVLGSVGSGQTVYASVETAPSSEGFHPSRSEVTSYADGTLDDDVARVHAAPSAFDSLPTLESCEGRLVELAGIARSLALPKKTIAALAAPYVKARRLLLSAVAKSQAGKAKPAAARLRAASAQVRRVRNILDAKAWRKLDVHTRDEIELRSFELASQIVHVLD